MKLRKITIVIPGIIAMLAFNSCTNFKLPKNISLYSSNGSITYLSKEETDVGLILHAHCETEDMMFYDSVNCVSGYQTDNPGLQVNIEGDEIQKKYVSLFFMKKYCTGDDLNVDIKLRSTNIIFNQFDYKIGLDPDDLPFEIVTNPFVMNAYAESGIFKLKKRKDLSSSEFSFSASGKDGKSSLNFSPRYYTDTEWNAATIGAEFNINVTWGSGGKERKAYPITFYGSAI